MKQVASELHRNSTKLDPRSNSPSLWLTVPMRRSLPSEQSRAGKDNMTNEVDVTIDSQVIIDALEDTGDYTPGIYQ